MNHSICHQTRRYLGRLSVRDRIGVILLCSWCIGVVFCRGCPPRRPRSRACRLGSHSSGREANAWSNERFVSSKAFHQIKLSCVDGGVR